MNSIETIKKKRLAWPDIAKALVMILVIAGHSSPPQRVHSIIFSFHMPFFFIVSGLFYKYRESNVKKDFMRLIVPYFICILILFFFLIVNPESSPYSNISQLIKSSFYASGSNVADVKLIGAIWFLPALFFAKRYLDFIFDVCQSEYARAAASIVLAIVSVVLADLKIILPMGLDVAMLGSFYLYIGHYLGSGCSGTLERKPTINFLLVLILCWYIAYRVGNFNMSERTYGYMFYLAIPGSVAASILLLEISRKLEAVHWLSCVLQKLGKHTMLLLCIHDLDWRLPFGFYQRYISKAVSVYSGKSFYWLIRFAARFTFDVIVLIILIYLYAGIKKIVHTKRDKKFHSEY